jgi:ABC-2 type transport system ATP-binding protein
VDGVTFSIAAGEVLCLLGANGAGKTTVIHLFLGFTRPDAGRARVHGIDVAADPVAARRGVAFVPERVALYPTLSGLENLAYFAGLAANARRDARDLLRLLEDVGLPETVARARAGTYSRGMQQRVGLAIAAARDAHALLLDEPASGLDPRGAGEVAAQVRRLAHGGAAVLMTTHDLFDAKALSTRIGILACGRLVATFRADELSHAELEDAYFQLSADPRSPR